MQKSVRNWRWLIAGLLLVSGGLSGCTPEKARALASAAVQFRVESLAAIDAIDTMRRRELEPPPRSQTDVRNTFINSVLNYRAGAGNLEDGLTPQIVDLAIDPYTVTLDDATNQDWNTFIAKLRNQYTTFAAIYDQLEGGSFLATDAVRNSAQQAKLLTIQMAYFSLCIDAYPPQLLQYRSAIVADLETLRQTYQQQQREIERVRQAGGSGDRLQQLLTQQRQIEDQTGTLMEQWQQVKLTEQRLLETTVTQTLKAATLGQELGDLSDRYEQISLDDLNLLIPRILNRTALITGRDYGSLKLQAATVVTRIEADPLWKDVTNVALRDVSQAVGRRGTTASTQINDVQARKCSIPRAASPVSSLVEKE